MAIHVSSLVESHKKFIEILTVDHTIVTNSALGIHKADLVLIISLVHVICQLYKLSKEQLVIYLRRDSRGIGAQATYPGVKHAKKHYQAMYG